MREIKFRARNAEVPRCWIYGYFLKERGCNYIINDDGKFKIIVGTECQYIGLKANDKEIYEGDIVLLVAGYKFSKGDKDTFIGYVKWVDDNAGFFIAHNHYDGLMDLDTVDKVIGNIYEDPELLK